MLKLKTLITGITCVSIWFAGHARPQTNGQPSSSFAIEWASGGGSGSLSAEYGAIHAIDGTKNMRIQGNSFKFRDTTGDRIECQLDSVNVAYGSEATLIHALEENGIGRPSTYAPIITTIVDRGYVEKDQKKLKTTPLGQAVNQVMMEQFPAIVDVKFSADMEKKLDVVEAGQADWVKTMDEFYQGFAKSLEKAEKNMEGKRVKVEDIPTDEICEKCGRPMVIKSGRYGKFVACSGFPECRNAHPLVKDTGGLCPLCGGHMLVRKSAKGRIYYGCGNYPKCNFMTWDEPVPEKCPQCGATLFKKKGQLYCAKEGCGFVKPVEKK